MIKDSIWRNVPLDTRARSLEARWRKACAAYLPHAPTQSFWRYADVPRRDQPLDGWKLHVSATVLNATAILRRIAPYMIARGVPFKAPRSLVEVLKLNSGLHYRYSQIGKIITVYPRNDEQAVALAHALHGLTRRFTGPTVPFDLRFTETSNVYYRYGAFQHLEINQSGAPTHGVYAPSGELVPDVREEPKPDWVSDPFAENRPLYRRTAAASSSSSDTRGNGTCRSCRRTARAHSRWPRPSTWKGRPARALRTGHLMGPGS